MKILHVVHGFLPEFRGGSELYVDRLCRALRVLGHESAVFCGSNVPAGEDSLEEDLVDGLRVFRVHRRAHFVEEWQRSFSPAVEDLFRSFLEGDRPDVVHLHHWKRLSRRLAATARALDVPVVLTFHDLFATCPVDFRLKDGEICRAVLLGEGCSRCAPRAAHQAEFEIEEELRLFRSDLRREVESASGLIAPSAVHRSAIASLLDVAGVAERIEVIPHGRIVDAARLVGAKAGSFPEGPLRIGHWGALDEIKGTDVLLDALDRLSPTEASKVELHLFGKPITERFGRRLERERRGRPVIVHGSFVAEDLAAVPLDLAAFPSRCAESYSFVLDEAFALGLPTIVSDRGALPERVGEAGFVVPAGRPDVLADTVASILRDPTLLLAKRAKVKRELPDMAEHAERVAEAYRHAIEAPRPPALTPTDEASRDHAALVLRTTQLEERELSLLELRSRVSFLEKRGWNLESSLSDSRSETEKARSELETRRRMCETLRGVLDVAEVDLERWRRLEGRWWLRAILSVRRGVLRLFGRRIS
ncbi:MAG: glycosyltransferase [Planctomycetes bacterium]|nr:glycosyltransferase [Planctomycetota bacterium]